MKYSIKLFKYKLQVNIDDDLPKVVNYFKTHNVEVFFDVQETTVEKGNALMQLMQPNDGKCDVVMYMFDRSSFQNGGYNGITFKVSPTLSGIYLSTNVVDDSFDYTWKSICHELIHTLFFKFTGQGGNIPMDMMLVNGVYLPYYKNEEIKPDGSSAPDGNFAQAWKLLAQYISPYKYFKLTEPTGGGHTIADLKPEFVQKLDKARGFSGIPYKITSGYRTDLQNSDVGGSVPSTHILGLACDVLVDTSEKRFKVISGALQAGFTRVGIYNNHIHLDIGKPPVFVDNVMWVINKD